MNSLIIKAYAKINLGLDVLRKREDGYHEVYMIMQSIGLHDSLTIKKLNTDEIFIKSNLAYLPSDQRNIIYRAAALFRETFPHVGGIRIDLDKKIPVSAGLAGGSTDAAATLIGLNRLFDTGLTQQELMDLGVQLGADVPYCIMLGTALSEGIGEILTPLPHMPKCHILLVKPNINVSTKHVYENLKLNEDISHPDIKGMIQGIEDHDLNQLTSRMDNILQSVTIDEYPIIDEIKDKMNSLGAEVALMSGSGPTVFGIFTDYTAAEKAYTFFLDGTYGKQVYLTHPYWPN